MLIQAKALERILYPRICSVFILKSQGSRIVFFKNTIDVYTKSIYCTDVKVKEAKIFKNGQSQAIRLPKEFRFKGESVYIKHFGNGVLLLPKDSTWSLLEESLSEFSDDFMGTRDQGELEDRNGLDS